MREAGIECSYADYVKYRQYLCDRYRDRPEFDMSLFIWDKSAGLGSGGPEKLLRHPEEPGYLVRNLLCQTGAEWYAAPVEAT
jgi:hypothetical protein